MFILCVCLTSICPVLFNLLICDTEINQSINQPGRAQLPNATYQVPKPMAFWFQRRWYLKFLPYTGVVVILVMWPKQFVYILGESDPGRSHTFVEIDHEIIFLWAFSSLPLIHSRRVVVCYKRKYVHGLLVNRLFKPAHEKVWLGEQTIPPWS